MLRAIRDQMGARPRGLGLAVLTSSTLGGHDETHMLRYRHKADIDDELGSTL